MSAPPPGRQLDALVARSLWRAVVIHEPDGSAYLVGAPKREVVPLPAYSVDVDESHRVVGYMHQHGYTLKIHHDPDNRVFRAAFARPTETTVTYRYTEGISAAHAICLAALAALNDTNRAR